ncbi:MAG: lysozyme inhibitor LprI family protein [Deltaproteobacteria bacterium]|nr:lysozyme inhibitor LprI family protein [Deltaproteobacteria bacterium]
MQLMDCYDSETQVQDKRLNDLYKKLSNIQSPETKKLLLTAQRNWLQYRDNWIKFLKTQENAVMMPEYYISMFLLDATKEQADHLETILSELE